MAARLVEPRLYLGRSMPRVESHCVGGGVAAVWTISAPGRAAANQDGAALVPAGDRAILAVADGVGGRTAGAAACSLALEALAESVVKAAPDDDLRGAVLDGIETASARVAALGVGAATTIAVVEIDGDRVRPYHVGDSAILVVGQRGRLRFQTVAHSPVGYAVESGLLGAGEAIHHDARHVVSNVVGADDMRIEIGPAIALRPRDTVVIVSDGVFDNLHVEEIVELARRGPLPAAAAAIGEASRARMLGAADRRQPCKPDDMTLVLFRRSARKREETP
jgi:serine/threonine protein phosphatase PrpC